MRARNNTLTLFIIASIIAAVVAIAAYQVVIHKYYWGPQGPPKKGKPDKNPRQR